MWKWDSWNNEIEKFLIILCLLKIFRVSPGDEKYHCYPSWKMQTFLQALLRRAVQKLQNWKKKLSALLNFFTRFTLFLQKDCAKIWHYYKNGGGKSVKLNHSCNFPSYTRHFFVLPWLWTSARFIRMVGTFPNLTFLLIG